MTGAETSTETSTETTITDVNNIDMLAVTTTLVNSPQKSIKGCLRD
ncbi:hypothetical protein ACFL0Q_07120 [Thermodesulfobacteriota bacterium]